MSNPIDIDTVFAIYINSNNQYILERIKKLSNLFNNKFYVSFVDNNSFNIDKFKKNIIFIPYKNKFSLSAQKNLAFTQCKSKYILISDPDFFYFKDFYNDLEEILKIMKDINKTPFIIFPAYYANYEWSKNILNSNDKDYNKQILSFLLSSTMNNVFDHCKFIAPYSNVILLSRDLMYYIGGYNENFDGFGSEDFEFMIRAIIALNIGPLPKKIELDVYQPATKYFFMPNKGFIGFRRMLELYTFPIEIIGKKVIHLYHEKIENEWYKKKDKKRIKFNYEINKYLKKPYCILDCDWIRHKNKIICIVLDKNYWRAFLTLRCNDFFTIRYNCIKISYKICLKLSKKYNTKNFALYDLFYYQNQHLVSQLLNNGYAVYKVSDNDLKKIGINIVNIDNNYYSISRMNLDIINSSMLHIKNFIYIVKKIFLYKINNIKVKIFNKIN